MSGKKLDVALLVFLTVLVGCQPVTPILVQPMPTQTVCATATPSSTPEPTVTSTATLSAIPTVTVSPTATPTAIATATATATATPKVISEDDFSRGVVILEIPKIQVKSALEIAKESQGKLDFSSLRENPVFVETRQLGENGVALIMGHRQWGVKAKVFARLDHLKEGDVMIVRTENVEMVFEVEESLVILPSTVWSELERLDALFVQREVPAVVLFTCTPYGTNWRRLLVVAKLKS